VHPAAERLHHGAGREVAGDRRDRGYPEDQDEDRGHQCPAAHAGESDHDADAESGERQGEIHRTSVGENPCFVY
jgi:hypothetical protein